MTRQILKLKGLNLVPFLYSLFLLILASEVSLASDPLKLKTLASSQEWQSLLRYERPLLDPWQRDSAIRDDDFFFSPQGKWNPLAELEATLTALRQPIDSMTNPNQHALCRFPARYKWLKKKLNFENRDSELKNCLNYQRWNEQGRVTSISIYFATGYFGNPASFFGHPLLKFNQGEGKSEFIDTSLNYGAMTPENENPVFYVLKGLFGGYTASFTRHDFFYHNHNYSETEMRDLWEYRLNLTATEVQSVVDRTWELLGKNHPYYFLVDNCAYRMVELLEEIFKKPLLFRNRLYVIPIDFFDNLAKGLRHDGSPMVRSVNLIPSRYTRLSKMYLSLSQKEQGWVTSAIGENSRLDQPEFQNLSAGSQAKILETLISYYTFRKLQDKENSNLEASRVFMIRKRFSVSGKVGFRSISYDNISPPHDSVNSFGLGVTQGYGNTIKSFQEFTIRPALYDELNPSISRPNNTSLEVFKTQFRLRDSKLTLRGMEVFRVSTLNTSEVNLPKTGNMAWRMRLGLRSQSQTCENCLVAFTEGGVGVAFNLWKGTDLYGLVKGGLQNNKSSQGTLYGLPEIGAYIRVLKNWKLFANYEYEKFFNGNKKGFDVWTLESRLGSSQWWDLRLRYKKRDDEQVSVSLWFYL